MADGWQDFVAGWVSGVAGLMVTQPIDFTLTRLQSGKTAVAEGGGLRGLAGMWRGVTPLVATVPLNNAMLMYGYGVGKRVGERDGDGSLLPVFVGGCAGGFVQSFLQSPVELVKLAAGSFAAIAAWVVGYPADLIKTRCQMAGGPPSLSEAARIIHAEGGIGAFYNGLTLKLLRAVPMSAVGFFVYEYTMGLLPK